MDIKLLLIRVSSICGTHSELIHHVVSVDNTIYVFHIGTKVTELLVINKDDYHIGLKSNFDNVLNEIPVSNHNLEDFIPGAWRLRDCPTVVFYPERYYIDMINAHNYMLNYADIIKTRSKDILKDVIEQISNM